jgi:hypothetical protein
VNRVHCQFISAVRFVAESAATSWFERAEAGQHTSSSSLFRLGCRLHPTMNSVRCETTRPHSPHRLSSQVLLVRKELGKDPLCMPLDMLRTEEPVLGSVRDANSTHNSCGGGLLRPPMNLRNQSFDRARGIRPTNDAEVLFLCDTRPIRNLCLKWGDAARRALKLRP